MAVDLIYGSRHGKYVSEMIIEVFYNNNSAPLFRPIPITKQEAIAQDDETNMSKAEIICKILISNR